MLNLIILINLLLLMSVKCNPVFTRQNLMKDTNADPCADLLHLENNIYKRDKPKNISGIPADMNIHWKTGNIFFTLISDEMKMSLQVLHTSGEFETIKVAGLGQSTCVDNLNDIVYLATDSGVYKYKEDGSIALYTALGEDVMYLATSPDGATMYIATWPQNRVSMLTNDGQKSEMYTAIPNGHGLTVDTRNNIYFVASKTTYILQSGQSIPMKIKGLLEDKMTGVFVSRSDEVYAMDEFSNLYVLDALTASAVRLGTFETPGVNTFAMDSDDNILIGVKGFLMKFIALDKNPCPEHHSNKIDKRHNFENTNSERQFGVNTNGRHSEHNSRFSRKSYRTKVFTSTTPKVPFADEDEDEDDEE